MVDVATRAIDELPEAYRRWRTSRLGRITDALEERLLLNLIGPVAGQRVLDVGCGDGRLALTLTRRGARVTGVDSSPVMFAAARARFEAAALPATLKQADVTSLPFADDSFDVVTAVTVLCFIADAERALAEMTRVLVPGGRLVVGELGRHSLWATKRRIMGWLGSATWRAARFRMAGELQALARSAGLEVETAAGGIFYPPCGLCAALLSPADARIGRHTTAGAAFIALAACKPAAPSSNEVNPDVAPIDGAHAAPGQQAL
jgi:ubiquinone/menaquinone biosynthesis C-methylase UbiE